MGTAAQHRYYHAYDLASLRVRFARFFQPWVKVPRVQS